MPPRLSLHRHLARILRQPSAAMPTLAGQQHLNGAHLGGGDQLPMMPSVSGLGAWLAPALTLSAPRPLVAGQPVGGRWLGGVGGVALTQRQLPLQIRDLLFALRNLLFALRNLFFALGYFTAEFFVLSLEPLIFLMELFPAGLNGVPMALRRCPSRLRPCPCRTHPPYVKRFGGICPQKSIRVPELLQLNKLVLVEARAARGSLQFDVLNQGCAIVLEQLPKYRFLVRLLAQHATGGDLANICG